VGTSSSQGSPRRDSAWRDVRNAYERGAEPAETAALLASAIPDDVLAGFLEAATGALSALGLEAGQTTEDLASRLARELAAENSLQREVANAAALRLAGRELPTDPEERARVYAAELGASLAEYFIARDMEGLVGTDGVPDISSADEVADAVSAEVRRAILSVEARATDGPPARRVADILEAGVRLLREQGTGDA